MLAAIFTGMLLSLAGIPLTVGFIGKFYIFFAGVESEFWILLATLIIGSGIGLYNYLRILYKMVLPREERNGFELSIKEHFASNAILAFLFISSEDQLPKIDYYISIMSLPYIFRYDNTIPESYNFFKEVISIMFLYNICLLFQVFKESYWELIQNMC